LPEEYTSGIISPNRLKEAEFIMQKTKLTRRDFFKAAGGSACVFAIPTILPSSVFGQNTPSNRINIGVIGTGEMGILNIKSFMNKPGAQVVAVCDVDRSHREAGRKTAKLPAEASYNDFRELIARPDIDAVVVVTPDHWHALISIMAVKAGKDVYCEKPLAYNVAEGRALCDTVKRYGRILQSGSHQRSDKNFRFACELVRNGKIGKLRTIKVEIPENRSPNPPSWKPEPVPEGLDYDMWIGPAPFRPYTSQGCHYNWHFLYGFGGGQLTNWGAHMIDIAQWGNDADLTGPVEVSGTGESPKEGLFETPLKFNLEYTYANGVQLLCSTRKPDGPETHVQFEGDAGWIFVSRERFFSQPAELIQTKLGANDVHLYRSNDHQQNFLDCVRLRKKPIVDAETGHRSATVCHIGNIAILLGRKLNWDPEKERFINDDQANRMLSRPMRAPWNI
jgi:predicted dehydrogenase